MCGMQLEGQVPQFRTVWRCVEHAATSSNCVKQHLSFTKQFWCGPPHYNTCQASQDMPHHPYDRYSDNGMDIHECSKDFDLNIPGTTFATPYITRWLTDILIRPRMTHFCTLCSRIMPPACHVHFRSDMTDLNWMVFLEHGIYIGALQRSWHCIVTVGDTKLHLIARVVHSGCTVSCLMMQEWKVDVFKQEPWTSWAHQFWDCFCPVEMAAWPVRYKEVQGRVSIFGARSHSAQGMSSPPWGFLALCLPVDIGSLLLGHSNKCQFYCCILYVAQWSKRMSSKSSWMKVNTFVQKLYPQIALQQLHTRFNWN